MKILLAVKKVAKDRYRVKFLYSLDGETFSTVDSKNSVELASELADFNELSCWISFGRLVGFIPSKDTLRFWQKGDIPYEFDSTGSQINNLCQTVAIVCRNNNIPLFLDTDSGKIVPYTEPSSPNFH